MPVLLHAESRVAVSQSCQLPACCTDLVPSKLTQWQCCLDSSKSHCSSALCMLMQAFRSGGTATSAQRLWGWTTRWAQGAGGLVAQAATWWCTCEFFRSSALESLRSSPIVQPAELHRFGWTCPVMAYVKRAGKPKPDHLDGKPDHLDGGAGHAGGLGAGAPWQHHPAACLRPQSGEKSGLCRGVHAHAIPCRMLTVLGTACTLQSQQSPAIMHIPWIQHLMLIASLLPCRQAWTPPQSSGRAS